MNYTLHRDPIFQLYEVVRRARSNSFLRGTFFDSNGDFPDISASDFVNFVNSLPTAGQIYLPNRRMGFFNENFPELFSVSARSFVTTIPSLGDNPSATFDFERMLRTPAPVTNVMMGFQIRTNDDWFDVATNIGEISNNGKSVIELKEFSDSFIIPKGGNSLRAFFVADGSVQLESSALLT